MLYKVLCIKGLDEHQPPVRPPVEPPVEPPVRAPPQPSPKGEGVQKYWLILANVFYCCPLPLEG